MAQRRHLVRTPLLGILLGLACESHPQPPPPSDQSQAEPLEPAPPAPPPVARTPLVAPEVDRTEELRVALQVALEELVDTREIDGEPLAVFDLLSAFYEHRHYVPVFVGTPDRAAEQAAVLEQLDSTKNHGLRPEAFHVPILKDRLANATAGTIETEFLLLDGLLHAMQLILGGQVDPHAFGEALDVERHVPDASRVLLEALERGEQPILSHLAARRPMYQRLVEARRGLAETEARGGWPRIDPAASDQTLRERLVASHDLPSGSETELRDGLTHFQRRHGLAESGVLDPPTIKALNVPVEKRIEQIEANLERWRWLPDETPPLIVVVNIAAFELYIVEEGKPIERMRTAVGKEYRQTPIFNDRITHIVLNPTWSVPTKLARKDLIPKIRKDGSIVEEKGIRLFKIEGGVEREVDPKSVDWSTVSVGTKGSTYRLRQRPGPKNALGRLKFMFPNRHNIYLHDTPEREVFDASARALSSGCIRLQHPVALAARLLASDPAWPLASIESAVDSGRQQTIWLKDPIPVYLTYWTAWVEADGTVQFRDDIYRRDARIITALGALRRTADPRGA